MRGLDPRVQGQAALGGAPHDAESVNNVLGNYN
jgi:hypothetical protein